MFTLNLSFWNGIPAQPHLPWFHNVSMCFCVLLQLLWAKDVYDRLVADELAKNVPDAEKLLESHQERKVCKYPDCPKDGLLLVVYFVG